MNKKGTSKNLKEQKTIIKLFLHKALLTGFIEYLTTLIH